MSLLYDLLLYVALAGGVLLGRKVAPPRGLEVASRITILALVASLGALLEAAGNFLRVGVLAPAILLAVALVGTSALFARLLGSAPGPKASSASEGRRRFERDLLFPGAILVAVAAGWGAAAADPSLSTSSANLIDAFLLLLLFEVGWTLRWEWKDLRDVPRPLGAALASAVVVGTGYVLLGGVSWRTSLAIVGGFGWYTLAGPLVAQSLGPTLGLVAFVANFLRENLTMTTSPALDRVAGADAIVASGGAASMDTTLLFAVEHGGPRAGTRSVAVGTILTLLAPVLLGIALGTL